jgi:hypothetical protein
VRAHAVEACGDCAAAHISSGSSGSDAPLRCLMVIIRVLRDVRVECRRKLFLLCRQRNFSDIGLAGASLAALAKIVAVFHCCCRVSVSDEENDGISPSDGRFRSIKVSVTALLFSMFMTATMMTIMMVVMMMMMVVVVVVVMLLS